MSRDKIATEYIRQENQADPMCGPDHEAIIAAVAEMFDVPKHHVKEVMVTYTVTAGAG